MQLNHRHTRQEAGGLRLGQKQNFSRRSQWPKMKKIFLVFITRKMEFILSNETNRPKSGIFSNNYWVE